MKLQKKNLLAQKRRWRIRKTVRGTAARPATAARPEQRGAAGPGVRVGGAEVHLIAEVGQRPDGDPAQRVDAAVEVPGHHLVVEHRLAPVRVAQFELRRLDRVLDVPPHDVLHAVEVRGKKVELEPAIEVTRHVQRGNCAQRGRGRRPVLGHAAERTHSPRCGANPAARVKSKREHGGGSCH